MISVCDIFYSLTSRASRFPQSQQQNQKLHEPKSLFAVNFCACVFLSPRRDSPPFFLVFSFCFSSVLTQKLILGIFELIFSGRHRRFGSACD